LARHKGGIFSYFPVENRRDVGSSVRPWDLARYVFLVM
jgi:hypothetical protein